MIEKPTDLSTLLWKFSSSRLEMDVFRFFVFLTGYLSNLCLTFGKNDCKLQSCLPLIVHFSAFQRNYIQKYYYQNRKLKQMLCSTIMIHFEHRLM